MPHVLERGEEEDSKEQMAKQKQLVCVSNSTTGVVSYFYWSCRFFISFWLFVVTDGICLRISLSINAINPSQTLWRPTASWDSHNISRFGTPRPTSSDIPEIQNESYIKLISIQTM